MSPILKAIHRVLSDAGHAPTYTDYRQYKPRSICVTLSNAGTRALLWADADHIHIAIHWTTNDRCRRPERHWTTHSHQLSDPELITKITKLLK